MTASRWNSNILDLLKAFESDELTLNDLLFKKIKVSDKVENFSDQGDGKEAGENEKIP